MYIDAPLKNIIIKVEQFALILRNAFHQLVRTIDKNLGEVYKIFASKRVTENPSMHFPIFNCK